jgi:2-keto-3-deoxygluconate permease
MRIKESIERIPGGLMVVPLLLGALLNTLDEAHLPPVQTALRWLGAPRAKAVDPLTGKLVETEYYELLQMGGFTTALFKNGALCLIGLFLVCVGAQMNFRVGRRALKKGLIITSSKWGIAVAVGYAVGAASDPFSGLLGLSTMTIIAAMSNGNGGLYAALTSQYGNRSDVGALSVISLNDGPFLTMLALGLLGQKLPLAAFLAVLLPMLLGFTLGQIDPRIRDFLKPGESLLIPFFAFALGAQMNFRVFLHGEVLAGGLALGVATVLCTGTCAAAMLWLFGERSQIGGVAEASTAGNAVQTPFLVATAAADAAQHLAADVASQTIAPEALAETLAAAQQLAQHYEAIWRTAAAQISVATMTTALLCPLVVILFDHWQRRRGIDGREED